MAEQRAPGPLGSTQGAAGTARNTTDASGIVGRVREQATAQLDSQKTKATDGLGTVAEAVRHTTRHLREGQHDTVARYAEQAADQIERFSQGLRDKDIGQLMNDAQQLARRQPALFVGGAFALGLLGARFLKSSAPDDPSVQYRGSGDFGNHVSAAAPLGPPAACTVIAFPHPPALLPRGRGPRRRTADSITRQPRGCDG